MPFEFKQLSQTELSEDQLAALYEIRYSVVENRLGNIVVPRDEVVRRCGESGAWICLDNGRAVAFSIASMHPKPMLWALFVRPSHEGLGIGQQLMARSMEWFRTRKAAVVTLSTDPGTRADRFIRSRAGSEAVPTLQGKLSSHTAFARTRQ
jgi:GNAT superfamily N-acetyltransferase